MQTEASLFSQFVIGEINKHTSVWFRSKCTCATLKDNLAPARVCFCQEGYAKMALSCLFGFISQISYINDWISIDFMHQRGRGLLNGETFWPSLNMYLNSSVDSTERLVVCEALSWLCRSAAQVTLIWHINMFRFISAPFLSFIRHVAKDNSPNIYLQPPSFSVFFSCLSFFLHIVVVIPSKLLINVFVFQL